MKPRPNQTRARPRRPRKSPHRPRKQSRLTAEVLHHQARGAIAYWMRGGKFEHWLETRSFPTHQHQALITEIRRLLRNGAAQLEHKHGIKFCLGDLGGDGPIALGDLDLKRAINEEHETQCRRLELQLADAERRMIQAPPDTDTERLANLAVDHLLTQLDALQTRAPA